MRTQLWIIEARGADGNLDFECPEPFTKFGFKSIRGITEDEMAKVIFQHKPDAILDGRCISHWPELLHPNWIARRKTW